MKIFKYLPIAFVSLIIASCTATGGSDSKDSTEQKAPIAITPGMTLKEAAEAMNLPKIDDDLYGVNTTTDSTAILNFGDEVNVIANFQQVGGGEINVPMKPSGKIGDKEDFPGIVSNALLNLTSGESGEFLTTAHALLGDTVKKMGLKPSDVIKINVTATLVPHVDKDSKDDKK